MGTGDRSCQVGYDEFVEHRRQYGVTLLGQVIQHYLAPQSRGELEFPRGAPLASCHFCYK